MGYDIYAFIEYQPQHGGYDRYRYFGDLNISHQYALFAVLAGVRNSENIRCVANPKGMPNKLSWRVEEEYEGCGPNARAESWLTTNEISEALIFLAKMKGEATDELKATDELRAVLAMMRHLKDPRLVFWFNN